MPDPPPFNPYDAPRALQPVAAVSSLAATADQFIVEQVTPLLEPGEVLRCTAQLIERRVLLGGCIGWLLYFGVSFALVFSRLMDGGLENLAGLNFLLIPVMIGSIGIGALIGAGFARPYFGAVTDRRIIVIKSKGKPTAGRRWNLGTESYFYREMSGVVCETSSKSMAFTIVRPGYSPRRLRAPLTSTLVSGQTDFVNFVQAYGSRPLA